MQNCRTKLQRTHSLFSDGVISCCSIICKGCKVYRREMNIVGRRETLTGNDRERNKRKSNRPARAGRNSPFLLFKPFLKCICLNAVEKELFTVTKDLLAYNYFVGQNKSQSKLTVLNWYTVKPGYNLRVLSIVQSRWQYLCKALQHQ